MSQQHVHDWRRASETSKVGSTLMECCLDDCNEIGYMLTGPAAEEMSVQIKETSSE